MEPLGVRREAQADDYGQARSEARQRQLYRAGESDHAHVNAAVHGPDECIQQEAINHEHMVTLYVLWYNFARIHKTLRSFETRLWSMASVRYLYQIDPDLSRFRLLQSTWDTSGQRSRLPSERRTSKIRVPVLIASAAFRIGRIWSKLRLGRSRWRVEKWRYG